MPSPMELLAPAGSLDVFQTAVECGADAVYIGAPTANARALARHFSLEEIAAMTDYAHQRGVKLYVAMNSLIKEDELPAVIQLLSVFAGIGIDALIIQDLGIYRLARHYFPELRLHASTLMGAHNSVNVRQFADMGFKRVVLAREMHLDEIATAAAGSPVEIEVFIHGAMCFAYSGLCLFSSFLGGKSGLRGRCVQPCRRKYAWQGSGAKGGGYLFSMNDLEGIGLIEDLRRAGVSSLKIEGRMRSRQYVGAVVRAYRMALDHPADAEAMREAGKLLAMAMGRKTTTGYFLPQADNALITPQYSGNIGLFVGKLGKCKPGGRAVIKLREPLTVGDRIRVHNEKSGDRDSVTIKEIWLAGKMIDLAESGQTVGITVPETAQINDPVYKVDTIESRQEASKSKAISPQAYKKLIDKERQRERIKTITASVTGQGKARGAGRGVASKTSVVSAGKGEAPRYQGRGRTEAKATEPPLPWWLKVDDLTMLRQLPRHNQPARIVVLLTRETFRQSKRISLAGEQRRGMIWSLPPVILEQEVEFYRQTVPWLIRQGFQDWQLSHVGQMQFFREAPPPFTGWGWGVGEEANCRAAASSPPTLTLPRQGGGDSVQSPLISDGDYLPENTPLQFSKRTTLNPDDTTSKKTKKGRDGKKRPDRPARRMKLTFHGHYSLNVLNSQTLKALAESGITSAQVSIEVDKELLADIARHKSGQLGLTVYGFPPLFTARPAPDFFAYDQKFVSPKGEGFVLKKSFEQTLAVPLQPFSLLDRLQEIKAAGIDYVVIDLSANLFKRGDLELLWRRLEGGHKQERLSSFNYRGVLQ